MARYLYLLLCLALAHASAAYAVSSPDDRFSASDCGVLYAAVPQPKSERLEIDYPCEMNAIPRIWRTKEPPKEAKPGDTWICPKNGAEMVYIPAGEYQSGYEGLVTKSIDHAFWIGRYPVTVGAYREFVVATGHKPLKFWQDYDMYGAESHPATGLSYEDAEAYAKWMGQRLAKPNEWEKAARGTDGRKFPWGNDWHSDWDVTYRTSSNETYPVGFNALNRSPYGVCDMASKSLEWVCDPTLDKPEAYVYTSTIFFGIPGQKSNGFSFQSPKSSDAKPCKRMMSAHFGTVSAG
ncbi:MAG: formylglycine-generating enzyme family protein, partial [Armatimonadota bacterium]